VENILNDKNNYMALNLFYEKLLYIINVRTTNKKIVFKNKRLKKWMVKGLLCSLRNKNELFLLVKKKSSY